MNTQPKFEWTEETIKEYGKYCVLNYSFLQMEDFIKSKTKPLVFNGLRARAAWSILNGNYVIIDEISNGNQEIVAQEINKLLENIVT